jgi:hypothetical protein
MQAARITIGLTLLAVSSPGLLSAIELEHDTLKAWEEYVRNADSRMQTRLDGHGRFLWADEAPDRCARLQQGEVLVSPVTGRGTHSVAGGLIHDWLGAAFIPNATLEKLLAVVHDYGRYKEFYKPVVADSKVLACTETDQKFSMVWQHRVLLINAAMEGQYQARDFAIDARRGYNIANTTQVREIEGYGQSGEYLLPPGQGSGYIWRLHSIARYEERDGGVYLELEAIALTRTIPWSLRWMVSPIVNHLSINSMVTSLRQTRDAVISLPQGPERIASCATSGHRSGNVNNGGVE